MRPPLVAALALLAACARDNQAPDGDGGTIPSIGGIDFRIASGAARVANGVLGLYLSDQPDACLAITQVPVGMSTTLSMLVSPAGDGKTAVAIVPGLITPGPGQGIAEIAAQIGSRVTLSYDASNGTITWTANGDGSTTIDTLDLGFSGTSDRLVETGLTVPSCD